MDLRIIILKLFIALLCGSVVGIEREIHEKAAGLRTHILVSIGACMFGMLGLEISLNCATSDILRLAQGVVTGIGFLGAGVIFREGTSVKGLTTAAGIWVMGAVGLAIGIGYYRIALLGTLFAFATITLFGKLEKLIKK